MKKPIVIIFSFLITFSLTFLVSTSVAQISWQGVEKSSPTALLDSVADEANRDDRIQHTSMDGVTSQADMYLSNNPQFRITNTLTWIKNNIHTYLQWIVFIGLSLATILVIYNGFMMVTNALHDQGELKKIQKNFIYIGIGVIILVGFYFLLDIIVSVINMLFA